MCLWLLCGQTRTTFDISAYACVNLYVCVPFACVPFACLCVFVHLAVCVYLRIYF